MVALMAETGEGVMADEVIRLRGNGFFGSETQSGDMTEDLLPSSKSFATAAKTEAESGGKSIRDCLRLSKSSKVAAASAEDKV